MACCSASVLIAWAIHLGAGPRMLGFLGALPCLAQLAQAPAAYVTSRIGVRRVAIWGIVLSRQVHLPLVALSLLPIGPRGGLAVLIAVAASSAVLGVLGGNAWAAWMGALIPSPLRGRYLGRRASLCTLGSAAASLATGALLDGGRRLERMGLALGVLSAVVCAVGAGCALLMRRMFSPREPEAPPPLRLADAIEPIAEPRGQRAIVFHAACGAAAGLMGSFAPLFMIESLGVGFVGVTLHAVATALARTVAAPLWGRVIDRAGVRPVLAVCSLGIGVTSLLWIAVTPSTVWLLALDALAYGAFDAGHALGTVALPLRIAPRRALPFWLAAFATAGGLAFASTSMAGGVMVTAWGYGALFGAAAVLRWVAALLATRVADPVARPAREIMAVALG